MKRALITGAAGAIGTTLRQGLRGRYPHLRLSDIVPLGEAAIGEELWPANLTVESEVHQAAAGCDAIVHLGATPLEHEWERIRDNNIQGTYHVFEAARRHSVSRVVFASSNHVTGFYRSDRRVGPDAPVRPDTRYGVSKVFGEALGRLYADKYGLSVVCLRIGSFRPEPTTPHMLATWISPRDTVELVRCALEVADIHFEVVYGVSANDRNMWDNPGAQRIGYAPQDNSEYYAERILAAHPLESVPLVEREFHGGPFCSIEFAGDPDKIA
ncbi:MAG: NAD(P)-dependent oxidoreductase [Gammaproteobacteria bacterium]|nr:NAD(P)-dependent oxidoreductase [Gammaproteobacteria bacterium]NIR58161.1 NAD(P)-dependent oxidoreductase [Gammaproteobacteria bacterium]NIR88156.1 NAD(P)-dependent oxidoreductase [Gammaproteobacteria bacterium]